MSAPTPDQVPEFIAAGLPCEQLVVQGDGQHFFATIVSAEFEGKNIGNWGFGNEYADGTPAPLPQLDLVEALLHFYFADGLPCEKLVVEGEGRHFFATIVSTAFEGLSRVRRHQRVYAALGDRMREQIHALSMKTLTPAEYAADSSAPDQHLHH